jgi:hypothetical protein
VRASVLEVNDVARITRYLTEAVADGDISRAAAEGAILDWTCDVGVLDAAVRRCPDGDSVLLLQRVVGRCRRRRSGARIGRAARLMGPGAVGVQGRSYS